MRRLLTLALVGLCAYPVYHTYRLNQDVAHLRDDPEAVSFFAYHRYGFAPQSVVFNVTTDHCSGAVEDVVPTFVRFLRSVDRMDLAEVRLAWQGSTIAVLKLPVATASNDQVFWESGFSVAALSRAVRCTHDGDLEVDWSVIQSEGSIAI